MLKNEIFLKEISTFLRSCTVKNKYFAQMTANQVMDKYGLDSLPDYFNPYYLHLFGVSTLDLAIPDYLIDDTGNRIANPDRKYKVLVGKDPQFTRCLLIRLDQLGDDVVGDKVTKCINIVKSNLCKTYLNEMGYKQDTNDAVPKNFDIWDLSGIKNKINRVKSYLSNYTPKNDRTAVDLIVGGSYNWTDLVENSPVYNGENSNGPSITRITNLSELYSLDTLSAGDFIHCSSEQKTYQYLGIDTETNERLFSRVQINDMFGDTVSFFKQQRAEELGVDLNLDIYINLEKPAVNALVVIGNLDWEQMYENYDTLKAIDNTYHPLSALDKDNNIIEGKLVHKGLITDIEFSNISETLGYSNVDLPKVGTRINYRNFHRAWDIEKKSGKTITVYTKNIPDITSIDKPIFYSDPACEIEFKDLMPDGISPNLSEIEETSLGPKLIINAVLDFEYDNNNQLKSNRYECIRSEEKDYLIDQGTFQFNGLNWSRIELRTLFEEELKTKWTEEFGNRNRNLDYITMINSQDKESFSEKLIFTDEGELELSDSQVFLLDRWEYTGWDTPIYVPTYDHYNPLTNDLTLYTRLFNRMRNKNIKTSLKYFIGSNDYITAQEENPSQIDFVKGVCYPVKNCSSDILNWTYVFTEGIPAKLATKTDYEAYTTSLRNKIAEAIDAPNFQLLGYDSTLLQEQEAETIVDAVRKTLSIVRERFDVKEFGYEELYYAAVWSVIWNHLPVAILTQRIKNLRTEAVHVDHIWEYLSGKGLSDYRAVLDLDQQVYLYKNIDYLQGNEGKQQTLKILSDKLLKRFGAEIRTKSVLLDTTLARENIVEIESALPSHLINGLSESVSANVRLLSEDLNEETSVIAETTGRIENFDDIFRREYESGLEPKYGTTSTEQATRIENAHNDIEIKKHSYAPTKLTEITRGKIMGDLTRISMAFMLQTLIRKFSGSEIGSGCVVNCQFEGLGQTKTFSVGECLALIFYALRKEMWYSFRNKNGDQIFEKNGIWNNIVTFTETGDASQISAANQLALINSLSTYRTCITTIDPTVESECDHSGYDQYEIFDDVIPNTTPLWLPYIGSYVDIDGKTVRKSLPYSEEELRDLIGDPKIYLRGRTIGNAPAYRGLMQVLSPYQYKSLEFESWNDMCYAEDSINPNARSFTAIENIGSIFETTKEFNMPEGVVTKYDAYLGRNVHERLKFKEIEPNIGGVVTGSFGTAWIIKGIPFPEMKINSHAEMINFLNNQVAAYLNHFLMVRSSTNFYFHQAMKSIYDAIRVNDRVRFSLVPGYTTYSDWFDNDGELKSAFRSIEDGSNQKSVYGSVANALISSLFPEDKITSSSGININKYNAIKQLFQQMCSYNIAFLNTASISYECLYSHPITVNLRKNEGENIRYRMVSNKYEYADLGSYSPSVLTFKLTPTNIGKYIGLKKLVCQSEDGEFKLAVIERNRHIGYYIKLLVPRGIPMNYSVFIRFIPRLYVEGEELKYGHNNRVTVDKIILRAIYTRYLDTCNKSDPGAFKWIPNKDIYVRWKSIPNYKTTTVKSVAYSEEGTGHIVTDHAVMFKITQDNLSVWRKADTTGSIAPRWVCNGQVDPNNPTNMTYSDFEYKVVTVNDIGKYTTKYYYQMKLITVEEEISSSQSWKGCTYVYEPTSDLEFMANTVYYTKRGVDYIKADVIVGDKIPVNNQSSSEKITNPKIYDVLGGDNETTVYYVRRILVPSN